MQRASEEAKRRAIKVACKELFRSIGGYEAAGSYIERQKSQMGRMADPNDDHNWLHLQHLVALEEIASRKVVTELLCKLAGGLFVPHLDLAAEEGSPAWLAMRLAQRLGDLSGEIARGLADDGCIDATEAANCEARLDEHDRVSAQLRSALRAIQEHGRAAPPGRSRAKG